VVRLTNNLQASHSGKTTESVPLTQTNQTATQQTTFNSGTLQLQSVLADPSLPLTPSHVLQLQKTIGNKAVVQLMKSRMQPMVQIKSESIQRMEVTEKASNPQQEQVSKPPIQLVKYYNNQDLPGAHAPWLTDVHFTYLSDRRGAHEQLHMTFSDATEPEDEDYDKHNHYWYNTVQDAWNWSSNAARNDPLVGNDDLAWYERQALIWGSAKETQYISTLAPSVRADIENEFEDAAATAQSTQDEIDDDAAAAEEAEEAEEAAAAHAAIVPPAAVGGVAPP
jgi:hypothetical protein